ncbi:MAG: hypothetical protein R3F43_30325 [bacterium]
MVDGPATAGPGSGAAQQYILLDRAGVDATYGLDALHAQIRQGRLFRTDRLRLPDGTVVAAGTVAALKRYFAEVSPDSEPSNLRAAPAIAGEGDTLTLLEIFARLYHQKETGRLFVQHAELGHERTVIFREGVPVAAWSNVEDEWIGEVLIHKGYIDQGAFDDAVELRQQTGVRLGSALVKLEKISARRLQMALSVQALDRLLNIFRAGEGTRFRFVTDASAAEEEVLLVARPREIIETAIATALSPAEVQGLLDGYGSEAIQVNADVPPGDLTDGDSAVLAVFGPRISLADALPRVAQVARLTLAEARVRVLALATFGGIELGDRRTRELRRTLKELQSQNYFDRRGVRMGATPAEVSDARVARRRELQVGSEVQDLPGSAARRLRGQIGALIDAAATALGSAQTRSFYVRAMQMGVDFEDAEARRHVEFDEFMFRGHQEMEKRAWSEARDAFNEASKRIPSDPRPYVQLGWARFLAGNSEKRVAPTAIKEVQVALSHQPDFDMAWMYIGKIHRLAGDATAAEAALHKAIQFNPRNGEAQSELRLIFSRELGTPGAGASTSASIRASRGRGPGARRLHRPVRARQRRRRRGDALARHGSPAGPARRDSDLKEVGQLVLLRLNHDDQTLHLGRPRDGGEGRRRHQGEGPGLPGHPEHRRGLQDHRPGAKGPRQPAGARQRRVLLHGR